MSQTHKIRYDVLIEPLLEGLQPVKRLWPVRVRLTLWIALELGIVAMVAIVFPRARLLAAFHDPHYALEIASLGAVGVLAAALALRSAIPGRAATRNELFMLSMLGLAVLLLIARGPATIGVSLAEFIHAGARCLGCTVILALLPWLALFWAVRRGAPMEQKSTGWLIGLAAFSFAFVSSRLGCSIDSSMHVLMWHAMPAAVGAALSAYALVAWGERSNRMRPQLAQR